MTGTGHAQDTCEQANVHAHHHIDTFTGVYTEVVHLLRASVRSVVFFNPSLIAAHCIIKGKKTHSADTPDRIDHSTLPGPGCSGTWRTDFRGDEEIFQGTPRGACEGRPDPAQASHAAVWVDLRDPAERERPRPARGTGGARRAEPTKTSHGSHAGRTRFPREAHNVPPGWVGS